MIFNKRILVTGVSSGLGRALVKKLNNYKNKIWGIARRGKLLKKLQKEVTYQSLFFYSDKDISKPNIWNTIISDLKNCNFIPEIIIFNAAIFKCDFDKSINSKITREILEVNYLSIIRGIELLMPLLKKNSQVIAISSSSAFKGSGEEGVGYAASKAALSIAFESLQLKYGKRIKFKTIYFGPIKTGMNPFSKHQFGTLSEGVAVDKIIKVLESDNIQFYYPGIVFIFLKLIKLLPSKIYIRCLKIIDREIHRKFAKI